MSFVAPLVNPVRAHKDVSPRSTALQISDDSARWLEA